MDSSNSRRKGGRKKRRKSRRNRNSRSSKKLIAPIQRFTDSTDSQRQTVPSKLRTSSDQLTKHSVHYQSDPAKRPFKEQPKEMTGGGKEAGGELCVCWGGGGGDVFSSSFFLLDR